MSIDIKDFKGLPIWKRFEQAISETDGKFDIEELFSNAVSLLDLYYKAFPLYTLHNRQHQKNILRIIGELLGENINNLSSLECVILILSTAYHDIGMVFNDSELSNIERESGFQSFLEKNYKAKLNYNENGKVASKPLIEWYCRWMHAERVWLYLDKINPLDLEWEMVSLKDVIGNICESHNKDASTLIDDSKFEIDFLSQADLRFCALLLRLGDILDFDNSRTPKSVYEFLHLNDPQNDNEEISKMEWNKHLCSNGFRIKHIDNDIQIAFQAGPKHPQIERNVQNFLDVIENELLKSQSILNKCSSRWRNFKLPTNIDRKNIKSQNYKKGSYRLTLDENQIINLLIGENLYSNHYVFIRELLQNAIDTSRMREFHEYNNGNLSFKSKTIEVDTWVDSNGNRWVRVDDYGMGMNEYIVNNHLLKKGNSYYSSDYFKIQKLNYKENIKNDFTPISRFGIGLLSCFIMGDAIEINTRAIEISEPYCPEEKIRLSIQGIQSEYFLQTEKDKHTPTKMPNKRMHEKTFRAEYGTSIAVRIRKGNDNLYFEENLRHALMSFVTCSPVPIKFSGEIIGVDFIQALDTQPAEHKFRLFSDSQKSNVEEVIEQKIDSDIGIEVIPVNITQESVTSKLKGQIVIFRLHCDALEKISYRDAGDYHFDFNNEDDVSIVFSKNHKLTDGKYVVRRTAIDITDVLSPVLKEKNKSFGKAIKGHGNRFFYGNNILLIHNGINIPNLGPREINFEKHAFSLNKAIQYPDKGCLYFGIIYLSDNLIPSLSVARNEIKNIDFEIFSNLYYATKKLINITTTRKYNYLASRNYSYSYKDIKNGDTIKNKIWDREQIINTSLGLQSIIEIKEKLHEEEIGVSFPDNGSFLNHLTRGLVGINFHLEYNTENPRNIFLKIKSVREIYPIDNPIDAYTPLLFVPFTSDETLSLNGYINDKHWVSKWILTNQQVLIDNYHGYLTSLINSIQSYDIEKTNKVLTHFAEILPSEMKPDNKKVTSSEFNK